MRLLSCNDEPPTSLQLRLTTNIRERTPNMDDSWKTLEALLNNSPDLIITEEGDDQFSRDILLAQYHPLLEFQENYTPDYSPPAIPIQGNGEGCSTARGAQSEALNSGATGTINSVNGQLLVEESYGYLENSPACRPKDPLELCSTCSKVTLEDKYQTTHHNWKDLCSSAAKGCYACRFLLDSLSTVRDVPRF